MLFLQLAVAGVTAAAAVSSAPRSGLQHASVVRQGSELLLNGERWTSSGANVYWLGLDENVIPPPGQPFYPPTNASYPTLGRITEVMNILNTMGARTIRSQTLGVSVGNPLSVMPALGQYNEAAFKTMDWAVYEAGRHGLRIFAPLTDNYDYYHGGKFDFLRFRGIFLNSSNAGHVDPRVMEFYNNATIVQDFKAYIRHLLTHRNQFNGLTYAEDPTIFAYETGNELGGPTFGDMDVPVGWTSDISCYIKTLAPHKLVVDGTYGVNASHLAIPSLDIFSDHFYPRNLTKLAADISLVGAAQKVYMAGEYDWTPGTSSPPNNSPPPSLAAFHAAIEVPQRGSSPPVIAGDLFWSLFGHDVPDCRIYVNHTDGYTLQYGNPANARNVTASIAQLRRHFFAMRGERLPHGGGGGGGGGGLPASPCPGPV